MEITKIIMKFVRFRLDSEFQSEFELKWQIESELRELEKLSVELLMSHRSKVSIEFRREHTRSAV